MVTSYLLTLWWGDIFLLGFGLTHLWSCLLVVYSSVLTPRMDCSFFRGDLLRLCLVGFWCGSLPVCLSLCPASGFTLW